VDGVRRGEAIHLSLIVAPKREGNGQRSSVRGEESVSPYIEEEVLYRKDRRPTLRKGMLGAKKKKTRRDSRQGKGRRKKKRV